MSDLVSETPNNPDFWLTNPSSCSAVIPSVRARNATNPGSGLQIEVSRSTSHHEARSGHEAHARVETPAVSNGSQTCAVSEMSENHATIGYLRYGVPRKFLH